MAIEIIRGKVNISGQIKEEGSKLKMNEDEEKRLIDLGFAKHIDDTEEIEEIIDDSKKGKK